MHTTLVIGSNAFSASHFVDLLLNDPEQRVVGVSRQPEKDPAFLPYRQRGNANFEFRQIHLAREPERLVALADEIRPPWIVNYVALNEIAPSHDNAADYFETNVVALARFMTELRKRPYIEKYVHISTPEVYGNCEYPLPETAPMNPSTPYAASKAAADLYLLTLFKNHGFPVVFTRATNYYGPGQQLWKILPKMVITVKKGQKIPLHGGGVALKTWIHARDAATGVLAALRYGRPGEVYHLSDRANVCTVVEALRRLSAAMGVRFEDAVEPAPARLGQDARYLLDYSKAGRELGWSPAVSFDDGLREVVAWVNTHWELVKDLPLDYVHRS